jgi:unsaturated chondroitin disaccharide hydrolase
MNAAVNILKALWQNFANLDPDTDDMIGMGSGRYPVPGKYTERQANVHISIIYGDYFFTEAILKLLGSEFFTW